MTPHKPGAWITFDCYGTLVDWQTGFDSMLRPVFGERVREVLQAYHRHEPQVEAERPFRLYREVLALALGRAASEVGLALAGDAARSLARRWGELPLFDDVEEALAQLRAAGCKLGVLTNCDRDLFAQTHRAFRRPFDCVVTAEEVKAYKPSLHHFQRFAESTSVNPADWVHVACSRFHDIAPARELGIQRIWLDRERDGPDAAMASVRVLTAAEVPPAVARLLDPAGR